MLANFQIPVDATKVVVIGKNLSSSFLYRGTIVYLTSDGSKRPVFVKAQANSELSSEHTFGVIDNDIPPNTEGPCVTIGTLDALDTRSTAAHPFTTDTLVDGDSLYVSPTVAGYVTNVQPEYPDQIVKVGQVIKTTPQTGVIVYKILAPKIIPPEYFIEENNVRSWTLTGKNLAVATQDSTPVGLFFKPDGTKMFIIGATADRVFEYNLSNPWDITTAVVNPTSLFIQGQDTGMNDIYISPNGLILYAVGATNDRIYRYNLSVAWDITTGVYVNFLAIGSFSTNPTGLYFRPDGTVAYVMGDGVDTIFRIDLSTPWDITTGVQTTSLVISPQVTGGQALSFNDAGTILYVLGFNGDDITQFNLSIPWDITTAVYLEEGFRFQYEGAPGGLYYNETYQVAYIVGYSTDTVYGLSTSPTLIKTDDTLQSNQLFVEDRAQINGGLVVNSPILCASSITALSSISSSGNLAVSGTAAIGTANNIGNTTSAASHSFGNGAVGVGTKTIFIGPNGLMGSNTVINIGTSINSTVNSIAYDNNFKRDVAVNGTLEVNGEVILSAPTGAIEFQDTFTEAVTTALQSHIPNIGTGWTKSYAGTATNVNVFSAGYASPAGTASNFGVIYTTNNVFSTANYEISTYITAWTSSDDVLWIFFRYQDLNNYYAFRVSTTTTEFRLYKRVAGILTAITSSIGYVIPGTPQMFTVRVVGDAITLLLDSTLLGTYYDSSLTLAGQCGIGFGNIGVGLVADDMSVAWRLDNFQVRAYTASDIAGTSYVNNGSFVVGNTTAVSSAKMQVDSTTQGMLMPRMTTLQKLAIVAPTAGLQVYDLTLNQMSYYNGSIWVNF